MIFAAITRGSECLGELWRVSFVFFFSAFCLSGSVSLGGAQPRFAAGRQSSWLRWLSFGSCSEGVRVGIQQAKGA